MTHRAIYYDPIHLPEYHFSTLEMDIFKGFFLISLPSIIYLTHSFKSPFLHIEIIIYRLPCVTFNNAYKLTWIFFKSCTYANALVVVINPNVKLRIDQHWWKIICLRWSTCKAKVSQGSVVLTVL